MMGSGKTYWMDRLAKKLKLPKYDLDKLIEDVEDRTIRQIFDESGEEHFRKMESIVLKWFADKDEFVLATGGGTPCFFTNMEWMNREGTTIWLDEDIDTLAERLITGKAHRPLLSGMDGNQLKNYLVKKREERLSFYRQAKIILKGDEISEKNLLSLIKGYHHA